MEGAACSGQGDLRPRTRDPLTRIAVISDTHWNSWDLAEAAALISFLKSGFDQIWHAGDVVDESVLEGLEHFAPVIAVKGNCDTFMGRLLPHAVRRKVGEVELAMIHGWDLPLDHLQTVVGRFGDETDIIIHGHTHRRRNQRWMRPGGGEVTVINPGSVTSPRGGETRGVGVLEIDGAEWSYEALSLR